MVGYNQCGDYDTVEKLAWDMSLQVGDTFDLSGTIGVPQYQSGIIPVDLSIVDSVYYDADNRKHIRFGLKHYPAGRAEFIEGAGSTGSPICKRLPCNFTYPFLLCSYKDGVQAYVNAHYQSLSNPCDPYKMLSVNDSIKGVNLIVYPSPASDYIKISGNKRMSSYHIVNSFGQTVIQGTLKQSESIDVSSLPQGYYIIKLYNNTESFYASFTKL
jgi:hypothetical protein